MEEIKELTREPDYNNQVKHEHSLKIVVEKLVCKMIKARKCNEIRLKLVENDFDKKGNAKGTRSKMCITHYNGTKKKEK